MSGKVKRMFELKLMQTRYGRENVLKFRFDDIEMMFCMIRMAIESATTVTEYSITIVEEEEYEN